MLKFIHRIHWDSCVKPLCRFFITHNAVLLIYSPWILSVYLSTAAEHPSFWVLCSTSYPLLHSTYIKNTLQWYSGVFAVMSSNVSLHGASQCSSEPAVHLTCPPGKNWHYQPQLKLCRAVFQLPSSSLSCSKNGPVITWHVRIWASKDKYR